MSRKFSFLLFALMLTGFFPAKSDDKTKSEEDEIIKVRAYLLHEALEGMMLDTPIDVQCNTFLQSGDLDSFDLTKDWNQTKSLILYPRKITDWNSVDTRAQLLLWHKSGKVDTICLCYMPILMINGTVYKLDSTRYGYPHPYDNLVNFLGTQLQNKK